MEWTGSLIEYVRLHKVTMVDVKYNAGTPVFIMSDGARLDAAFMKRPKTVKHSGGKRVPITAEAYKLRQQGYKAKAKAAGA